MNFPEIGPAHDREIEISGKFWMIFSGFADNLSEIRAKASKGNFDISRNSAYL